MTTAREPATACEFRLYVSSSSGSSKRAIRNLRTLCATLPFLCEVSVIDVLDAPDVADAAKIVCTPTLEKTYPDPPRKVVGDLSNLDHVVTALDFAPAMLAPKPVLPPKRLQLPPPDRYREVLVGSPDGILLMAPQGSVLFANPSAQRLLQSSEDELMGGSLGLPWIEDETALRIPVSDGSVVEARSSVFDWSGGLVRMVCLRDVTQHVANEACTTKLVQDLLDTTKKLHRDATIDPLAGVLNRRGLSDALGVELSRERRSGNSLSVLLIDCDDFKSINDSFGHTTGDIALRAIVETIVSSVRPQDRVGRVGGDEFVVLLPATQVAAATLVGERILRELALRPIPDELHGRALGVSIGAAQVPDDATALEDVIRAASEPLKISKRHGKRRVSRGGVGFEGVDEQTGAQLLAQRQLRVVSQGIIDLRTGTECARELLVRGPPGDFEQPRALFELARTLGLTALFDMRCLRLLLEIRRQIPCASHHINVLPSTLLREDELAEVVASMDPSIPLCLELSRQQAVGDPMQLASARAALRRRGVAFALDNVGFGRADLEALVVLEPDLLKLNRALVTNVANDAGQARSLQRLLNAARRLNIEVVAQGVETRQQVDALLRLGVCVAQGFFWEKPTSGAEA